MPRIEVLTSNLLAASLFPRYRNSCNLLRMLCVSQVVKHILFLLVAYGATKDYSKMKIRNIRSTDYIVSVFATHSVYLDANILLDANTSKNWKDSILPRLARCNRKFIVIASVLAELRDYSGAAEPPVRRR